MAERTNTCLNCRFWNTGVDENPLAIMDVEDENECRRRSPVAEPRWPLTAEYHWCGEHEAADPATVTARCVGLGSEAPSDWGDDYYETPDWARIINEHLESLREGETCEVCRGAGVAKLESGGWRLCPVAVAEFIVVQVVANLSRAPAT